MSLLPNGSCAVLFDCYGGGSYLFSNDKRHRPDNAYLQIANDLAVKLRTPLLLQREGSQSVDLRRFLRRLSQVASVVAASPEALLVVIVDTADNAVSAAEKSNERCL